jgi:hypothetical protein
MEKLMPPRDPQLPEGTDAIINGAASTGGGETGTGSGSGTTGRSTSGGNDTGGGSGGGFVATGGSRGGNDDAGQSTTDKLVTQVREQVVSLRGQATDKIMTFADDGKGRATTFLDDLAAVIDDAARSIEDRLGGEYAGYARQASGAVSNFAGRVRDKSIDDLMGDTRDIVRKSPGVAIAAAAVAGFALMRVIRTGIDASGGSGGSGGEGRARTSNSDTTTSGGA